MTSPFCKLQWLYDNCLTVSVDSNDHRNIYAPIKTCEELRDIPDDDPLKVEILRHGTYVVIHVYPDTPIGFFHIIHWNLENAIELAYGAVRRDRGLDVDVT